MTVLGARCSGKSTLIQYWQDVPWPEGYNRTLAPGKPSHTKLKVDDDRITFTDLQDLTGNEDAWPVWKKRVMAGGYVLYLVDARALCGCLRWTDWRDKGRRGWDRLESDCGQISSWMKDGSAKLCTLVVTHTDEDCRRRQLEAEGMAITPESYDGRIISQLEPLVMKLGTERVRIAIGSLANMESARIMTELIMAHIAQNEGSKA